jgi:hypothetical protein
MSRSAIWFQYAHRMLTTSRGRIAVDCKYSTLAITGGTEGHTNWGPLRRTVSSMPLAFSRAGLSARRRPPGNGLGRLSPAFGLMKNSEMWAERALAIRSSRPTVGFVQLPGFEPRRRKRWHSWQSQAHPPSGRDGATISNPRLQTRRMRDYAIIAPKPRWRLGGCEANIMRPFTPKPQMTAAEFKAGLHDAGFGVERGRIVDVHGRCPGEAGPPSFGKPL